MKIEKFREEIELEHRVLIGEREFEILEIVHFQLDDGTVYTKLFLEDGYVLADDAEQDVYILVEDVKTDFIKPFPELLEFDSKRFTFQYSANAKAIEVSGEEIFAKGDMEKFWDYESRDGSYLSLGIVGKTGKRMDLCGRIVQEDELELV
ncbi:DUF4178 domain-containing protein [bacterium]|jgi:hypothetical protein|nr:DUF4178 domain-containing protein [bacterium]MBT4251197.1 DUF4178 domain-containing protein [bacterium]MBT4598011.1 DUF4178 domain-containing protein [bacterium]MBT6753576.1 DUF4178 domain-containing protein [bacterium]MBT7037691.1 DUF4178 domain-containing protein [bacterium]